MELSNMEPASGAAATQLGELQSLRAEDTLPLVAPDAFGTPGLLDLSLTHGNSTTRAQSSSAAGKKGTKKAARVPDKFPSPFVGGTSGSGSSTTGAVDEEKMAADVHHEWKFSRMYLFYNPFGGHGRARRAKDRVEQIFKAAGMEVDVRATEFRNHLFQMAKELDMSKVDACVVLGGDGSLSEFLSGFLTREDNAAQTVSLGVIAGGTGNCFATSLSMMDIDHATEAILKGTVRPCDVGRVTFPDAENGGHRSPPRYFISLMGFGLGADTAATAETCRNCCAFCKYSCSALCHVLCGGTNRDIQCDIDGVRYGTDAPSTFISIHNNAHVVAGSRLLPAPFARVDDGCLDAVFFRGGRGKVLGALGAQEKGTHVYMPNVDYVRFRKMRIATPIGRPVHVDGEMNDGHCAPVDIECVPGAVRVFYKLPLA